MGKKKKSKACSLTSKSSGFKISKFEKSDVGQIMIQLLYEKKIVLEELLHYKLLWEKDFYIEINESSGYFLEDNNGIEIIASKKF